MSKCEKSKASAKVYRLNENTGLMNSLMKQFNFKTNTFEKKKNLNINDVNEIETYKNKIRPYIGFKPIYKLYKPLLPLLTKFYTKYNTPLKMYEFDYYNENNKEALMNNYGQNMKNVKVSKTRYNFGDLINFSNYRLTNLYYVDENYTLQRAWGEYYLQLNENFSKYVIDFEHKFQNLLEEIYTGELEIDSISLHYNDNFLTREFKGFFPKSYKFQLVFIDDLNLEINNGKYSLEYIPLRFKDGKLHLKNKKLNVKVITQLFQRLNRIKKNKNSYKFMRLRTNAFNYKNYRNILKNDIQKVLNKNPQFSLQHTSGSIAFPRKNPLFSNYYIGVLGNEIELFKNLKNFMETNNNQIVLRGWNTKGQPYTSITLPNYLRN